MKPYELIVQGTNPAIVLLKRWGEKVRVVTGNSAELIYRWLLFIEEPYPLYGCIAGADLCDPDTCAVIVPAGPGMLTIDIGPH